MICLSVMLCTNYDLTISKWFALGKVLSAPELGRYAKCATFGCISCSHPSKNIILNRQRWWHVVLTLLFLGVKRAEFLVTQMLGNVPPCEDLHL